MARLTRDEIQEDLRNKDRENLEVVNLVEKFFQKKRGYVFKMPKPGEPVILLLSGGMDSIVAWEILMAKFKLHVYPLHINIKKFPFLLFDNQYLSVKTFEKKFKKKYPKFFHPVQVINHQADFQNRIIDASKNNPNKILEFIDEWGNINIQVYSNTGILASYALDYWQYLGSKWNKNIETIFTANLASDGLLVQNQTLTALRSQMLDICCKTGNYNLQFSSIFAEKDLGIYFDKNDIAKLAVKYNVPLHKTWTCWKRNGILPCGECVACLYRRDIMQRLGLRDNIYFSDVKSSLLTFKSIFYKLLTGGKVS